MTIRLREIPYNYTSFSDREIVIRLLGAEAWRCSTAARRARHRPLGAHALRGAGRHLGGAAQPVSARTTCSTTRPPRRADRRPAPPPRRDREARARATRPSRWQPAGGGARRRRPLRRALRRHRRAARRVLRALVEAHPRDNICFDGLARVSHVTDATDWRVEYPFVVLYPGHRGRNRPAGEGCIALGLTIIPRGGGTGYTGGAVPLTPGRWSSTPKSSIAIGPVEKSCCPASTARPPTPPSSPAPAWSRARDGAAEAPACVFAVDPTSADASCIGGNIAMNAGGKKAVLWGTALDNLASWKMVDARRQLAGGRAPRPQPRQDPRRRPACAFRLKRFEARRPHGARRCPKKSSSAGRALPQRPASARTSPTSSSAACPACRRKAATASSPRALDPAQDAAGHAHRVPGILRPGARSRAGHRRDQGLPRSRRRRQRARVLLAGLEHLDERYVKAVGYATKAKRHGRPKMVLIGDIVGDDETRSCRRLRSGAHRQRPRRRRLHRRVGRARKTFWLDRARTAAIARHTNAFKINEDVVIPLPRMGDYCDGIERINIELSIATSCACATRCRVPARRPAAACRRRQPRRGPN
jgi:FAD/FMN-containing dehydrogenase